MNFVDCATGREKLMKRAQSALPDDAFAEVGVHVQRALLDDPCCCYFIAFILSRAPPIAYR